jgi:hypothetical protein
MQKNYQKMTTQSQHTPSPWIRSRSGKTFQIVAGSDGNGDPNELVATVHPIGYNCEYKPCDETKANARLISASPDLLAALETLLSRSSGLDISATHEGLKNCEAIAKAREAIRKAKGEA